MSDDKHKIPPKQAAAKDRVYAYLAGAAPEVMDILHEVSVAETAKLLTANPHTCSMCKILMITAVREIFDQVDPTGGSPVGKWEHIDHMRMMAGADIRMQCAEYVSDIWREGQGSAVDCRIALNKFIENGVLQVAEDKDTGKPHWKLQAMGDIMTSALEGLITAYECFGEEGANPDPDRLKKALDENAQAYLPESSLIDQSDREAVVKLAAEVCGSFETLCTELRKEAENG